MKSFETRFCSAVLMGGLLLSAGCKKTPPATVQNADGSVTVPAAKRADAGGAAATDGGPQPRRFHYES